MIDKPECNICGKKVWNSQFAMISHLIEYHPIEFFTSRHFQQYFRLAGDAAYQAGAKLGKALKNGR